MFSVSLHCIFSPQADLIHTHIVYMVYAAIQQTDLIHVYFVEVAYAKLQHTDIVHVFIGEMVVPQAHKITSCTCTKDMWQMK